MNHEDFNEGIIQVQAKKKASLNYYAWGGSSMKVMDIDSGSGHIPKS